VNNPVLVSKLFDKSSPNKLIKKKFKIHRAQRYLSTIKHWRKQQELQILAKCCKYKCDNWIESQKERDEMAQFGIKQLVANL